MLDSDSGLIGVELDQGRWKEGEARLGIRASVPQLTALLIMAWPIRYWVGSLCGGLEISCPGFELENLWGQ